MKRRSTTKPACGISRERMRQRFANISICCLQFLWITVENYHKVYGPAHEAHECRVMRSRLCKPDGGSRSRLALMADRGAPSRDFSQSKELTALVSIAEPLRGRAVADDRHRGSS